MQHQHVDRPHLRGFAAVAVIGRRPLANFDAAHAGSLQAPLAPSCCRAGIMIATLLSPSHAKGAVRPTEARRCVTYPRLPPRGGNNLKVKRPAFPGRGLV